MDYNFTLQWHELPEDLREAKISEYIENNNDSEGENEDVDDRVVRADAERQIKARFPIYF